MSDNFETYPIHGYLAQPISNQKILVETASLKLYFELLSKSVEKGIENLKRVESTLEPTEPITQKGFYPSDEAYNDSIYDGTQDFYAPLREDLFDADKGLQILDLTKSLAAQNIEIVFIEMPTNKLGEFLKPDFIQEYENFLTELADRYSLVTFDNHLEEMHYRNIDHMNSAGATIFSTYLAKQPVFSIE
ncbi:MAG: hypothetical protein MK086_04150 [Flavobacteriales bacterium]|nr:hypothetical protein [Flavobacteriales bacterium]